jgi:hypothetical protein
LWNFFGLFGTLYDLLEADKKSKAREIKVLAGANAFLELLSLGIYRAFLTAAGKDAFF